MIRLRSAIVIAFVAGLIAGCSSSDQAGGPNDMEQMAAMMDARRASASAATSNSNDREPNTSPAAAKRSGQSAPSAQTSPAPKIDPSLPAKRGFDLKDWSSEAAHVFIKADVDKAAEALARQLKCKVEKDVLRRKFNLEKLQAVVFQLEGHSWSIFASENDDLEELLTALSHDADVLVFYHSDFNGWAAAELHRGGRSVEALHWGGVEEKLGEDGNPTLWDTEGQVTNNYDDGITIVDSYLFRSKLRKITPAELQKGEATIDDFFRHHDAYLPDNDDMPWFDFDTELIDSPLGPAAFAGVHGVIDSP